MVHNARGFDATMEVGRQYSNNHVVPRPPIIQPQMVPQAPPAAGVSVVPGIILPHPAPPIPRDPLISYTPQYHPLIYNKLTQEMVCNIIMDQERMLEIGELRVKQMEYLVAQLLLLGKRQDKGQTMIETFCN